MSRPLYPLCVCIGVLAATACSKQEPAVSSAPISAGEPTTPVPSTAPAQAPAESSLSLKRGMVTLTAEQATLQPCGEQVPLWIIDQTDGVLRQTFADEPLPLELYLEAHGERAPLPANNAAARTFPAAFILEEVLYATPSAESQGCDQAAPNYIVAARGNEPFWSVEVAQERMVWRQPEAPQEIVIPASQAEDAEGAVGFTGSADGHTLEFFVEEQSCRDSMSGAFFAYSARAVLDGKEFKGCARIGE